MGNSVVNSNWPPFSPCFWLPSKSLVTGEANMPRKCVVNVTQVKSVDKQSLREKIGTLSKEKMAEVYEGIKLVMSIP